jgi:hypothetical protein
MKGAVMMGDKAIKKDEFIKKLEYRLKDKVNKYALLLGTDHAETLKISQQLDIVINKTQRALMKRALIQ